MSDLWGDRRLHRQSSMQHLRESLTDRGVLSGELTS